MMSFHRVRMAFHNELRFRDLSWWRRAWYRAWDWIEYRVYRRIYPHFRPRTWYERRRSFYKKAVLPASMTGFVYGDGDEGWVAEVYGVWCQRIVTGYGWTEGEARGMARDILDLLEREAGVAGNKGYSVLWLYQEPGNQDKTWTA